MQAARQRNAGVRHSGKTPARKILRYTILPLYAANGEVSISDIIRFITTAPTNPTDPTSAEWQKRSFMYEVMDRATRRPRVPLPRQTMKDNLDFWAEEYPAQDAGRALTSP